MQTSLTKMRPDDKFATFKYTQMAQWIKEAYFKDYATNKMLNMSGSGTTDLSQQETAAYSV